jgi:hypothetical protein
VGEPRRQYARWKPEKAIRNPRLLSSPAAQQLRTQPCAACRRRPGVTLHHIVSRAQRGDDVLSNLIQLCVDCHDALHHSPRSREIYLSIGRSLTLAQIAYVIGKRGAGYLERVYGVEVDAS